MIFCLKRFFFLEKFGIIFMKEKIKKRVKMRVKIYSVYIVFEDDSGNYAEFNCGDLNESEQANERWKNLYRQCEDVPYHFSEIRYYEVEAAPTEDCECIVINQNHYPVKRGYYDVVEIKNKN